MPASDILWLLAIIVLIGSTIYAIRALIINAQREKRIIEEAKLAALEAYRKERLDRFAKQAEAQAASIERARRLEADRVAARLAQNPSIEQALAKRARSLAAPPRGTNGGYKRPTEAKRYDDEGVPIVSPGIDMVIAQAALAPIFDSSFYSTPSFDSGSCSVDTSSPSFDCSF